MPLEDRLGVEPHRRCRGGQLGLRRLLDVVGEGQLGDLPTTLDLGHQQMLLGQQVRHILSPAHPGANLRPERIQRRLFALQVCLCAEVVLLRFGGGD